MLRMDRGSFPLGSIMEGTVLHSARYGVFVEVDAPWKGFVDALEISDKVPRSFPDDYPAEGERVKAVVIACDQDNAQIRLSLKHSRFLKLEYGLEDLRFHAWPEALGNILDELARQRRFHLAVIERRPFLVREIDLCTAKAMLGAPGSETEDRLTLYLFPAGLRPFEGLETPMRLKNPDGVALNVSKLGHSLMSFHLESLILTGEEDRSLGDSLFFLVRKRLLGEALRSSANKPA